MSSSEPRLECYVRNVRERDEQGKAVALKDRRDAVVDRMEALRADGRIADFEVFDQSWDWILEPENRKGASGMIELAANKLDAYTAWAGENNLSLEPYFNDADTLDGLIRFPDLFVAAYEDSTVCGVFPCSDGTTTYGVEAYLDALEADEDWRDRTPPDVSDEGTHADLKRRLIESDDIVGTEWEFVIDEYAVRSGRFAAEQGRIDLVFEHTSGERFLLVEVKLDRAGVDEAIGQIVRYRQQFLDDQTRPDVDPDDVELAIAAPEFHDSHRDAADAAGIRLIHLD